MNLITQSYCDLAINLNVSKWTESTSFIVLGLWVRHKGLQNVIAITAINRTSQVYHLTKEKNIPTNSSTLLFSLPSLCYLICVAWINFPCYCLYRQISCEASQSKYSGMVPQIPLYIEHMWVDISETVVLLCRFNSNQRHSVSPL